MADDRRAPTQWTREMLQNRGERGLLGIRNKSATPAAPGRPNAADAAVDAAARAEGWDNAAARDAWEAAHRPPAVHVNDPLGEAVRRKERAKAEPHEWRPPPRPRPGNGRG